MSWRSGVLDKHSLFPRFLRRARTRIIPSGVLDKHGLFPRFLRRASTRIIPILGALLMRRIHESETTWMRYERDEIK
jgi:hypothetical protein